MNLYKYVSNAVNDKLGFVANLEIPRNREFGDFSTNAAMVGAKSAGKNPRELANEILPKIAELDFVADATIAGPGFINIKLRNNFIWGSAGQPIKKSESKSIKIDLDYGGYNVGKALHIGHLRTTMVGDTYNRVAKYLGYQTKSYNHIGDWGRPMGLIIAWILEYGMPTSGDELNKIYPASTARASTDESWMAHAKEITAELQAGNPEYKKIYDAFMEISLNQMSDILKRLNVLPFDVNMGERAISPYVPEMQQILKDKNLLTESDGALIVNVKTDEDTAPMPPLMFRTSGETQTYAAADLTAIYYREKTDKPDSIEYFTDFRQNLHFQQVFRVAKMTDITSANLFHTGFGNLTGKDGKPFKTRDGGVAGLSDIIDMVNEAVDERVRESGKTLDRETIDTIALAALKFNDLIHDVKSDYIFDPAQITSFEGRTGPYILYTAVRLNSVLKRAGNIDMNAPMTELSADERNLLIGILEFERTVQGTFDNRATDILANYAYDLSQLINTFYHNCPILRDDVPADVRAARIRISKIALDTLSTVIDLMGLKVPEEM
ncbi:arginine--tRNA ligase [Lachnospiraceae bacterium OttesenSCG-928-E19]|nr:arginine--tRNA ligase [Lachnospiraceae bacterium OttesenSCG-928-E19]